MLRGRMTIAEAAAALGIPIGSLKYLQRSGKVPEAKRDAISGFRVYSEDHVEMLRSMITAQKEVTGA